MRMVEAIPALPVKEMERSLLFYKDTLGFLILHVEDGFAVLGLDEVQVHLWLADDENWRKEEHWNPVVTGAESFIAGTSSCRIGMKGVDDLYERFGPMDITHPNAPLEDKPWGTREFSVLDPDRNLITFFEWR